MWTFQPSSFPKKCLECKREGKYVCPACLKKVAKVFPFCAYCQKPSIDGITHAKCASKYRLDGLTSIFKYEGVVRKAIVALKFKYALQIAKEIIEETTKSVQEKEFLFGINPILIPIPIHWYRGNFRGFNQTEVLGKLLSRKFSWKQVNNLLIRKKWKVSQTELKGDERRQNTVGVFEINKSYKLQSPNYILLDDVWTTGSTLKEAAKVLKHAGVQRVWGLTIAS